MLYAELGIKPIEIHIKSRMIGFWIATLNSENSKLSKLMYNIMLSELGNGQNYRWLNNIKHILISVGRAELLDQQFIYNQKSIKAKIVKTLNDLLYKTGTQKRYTHQRVETIILLKKM